MIKRSEARYSQKKKKIQSKILDMIINIYKIFFFFLNKKLWILVT